MRIAYLCQDLGIAPDGPKGGAAHVRGFLRAALDLGHEVTLLSPHGGTALSVGGGARVPVRPIPRPRLKPDATDAAEKRLARALRHLWVNVEVERVLEEHARTSRPDLVYERYSPFGAAGALTCRRLGLAHLLEVNAPLAWEGARYRGQALPEAAEALERAAFQAAGGIVAVSEELESMLVADGVAPGKVLVAPNGVDGGLFAPEGPVRRVAPGDRIVVGFVGSLKPWHGVEELAEAFRMLAHDPRLHLLVVGDGPEGPRIDALERELPGRVTRTGALTQSEVAAHLRGVDVAVAPYPQLERFYYSPLKVLEYMASACAVVASDIGQTGRLVRHEVNGLKVTPGDAGELAGSVRRLVEDAELRARLGSVAAAEVRREHLWTHRVAQVLATAARAA